MLVFFIHSSKRAPSGGLLQRCRVTAFRGCSFSRRCFVDWHRFRAGNIWLWTPQGYLSFRQGGDLSTASQHSSFSLPERGDSMAPRRLYRPIAVMLMGEGPAIFVAQA